MCASFLFIWYEPIWRVAGCKIVKIHVEILWHIFLRCRRRCGICNEVADNAFAACLPRFSY